MILVAPDKFKGSLSAKQVCDAIKEALQSLRPGLEIVSVPLADGGEGTASILTEFTGGSIIKVSVMDPLFRPVEAEYGISADGLTAFIEMAKASGLQLLKKEERNPLLTSTFGTGQLIADALDRKVKKIIFGIGGSATNDGGMGMAAALGFDFLSAEKVKLEPVGENLIRVDTMKERAVHPKLRECTFITLHDVKNPLYGKEGAAPIFAEQKGATPAAIKHLDLGLAHFAEVMLKQTGTDIDFPGAGAGGGIAALAKLVLHAQFAPGIDFILRFTNLERQIERASLVITGEGKIDEQTLSGKVVKGVAQLCVKHKKPCIAFAGKSVLTRAEMNVLGVQQVVTLMNGETSESEAVDNAYSLLKQRVSKVLPFL